jgi:hypothetical protein
MHSCRFHCCDASIAAFPPFPRFHSEIFVSLASFRASAGAWKQKPLHPTIGCCEPADQTPGLKRCILACCGKRRDVEVRADMPWCVTSCGGA